MKSHFRSTPVLGLLAVMLTVAGCNKVATPPEPIAVEDTPASLEKLKAGPATSPEAQALLHDAIASLNAKDYPKSLFLLQALSGRPDLTPEHQSLVARSLLSVNKALAAQAEAGNAQAQAAMQHYRSTK